MRTPDHLRDRCSRSLDLHAVEWLLDAAAARVSLPLQVPTAAQAAVDVPAVQEFIRAWQGYSGPAEVEWAERRWHAAGLGVQRIPVRARVTGAAAVAEAAGRAVEWTRLESALEVLLGEFAGVVGFREAAAKALPLWRDLPDEELDRVHRLCRWFLDHPGSGLRPRAVAVEGVHGKWLEQHRSLVTRLVAALGISDLGLIEGDEVVRLRRLDPLLRGSEGLCDVGLPVAEAAGLWPSGGPRTVLVVENKETFLSLPETDAGTGAVVVWGGGYAAALLARLPWLARARVLYWGDLDADGFAILHRLRGVLPDVESVMMDPATVSGWSHLGVPDPGDATRILGMLTDSEEEARRLLMTGGNLRIEQERIRWDRALAELRAAGLPV